MAFPTDQRGTYFDQFWGGGADIKPLHLWGERPLGDAASLPPREKFVMLMRSALLRRYPNAVIYLTPAVLTDGARAPSETPVDEKLPVFAGAMQPDINFFGFDVTADEVSGSGGGHAGGYYLVIQQHPTEPRFGLDTGVSAGNASHLSIARRRAQRSTAQRPAVGPQRRAHGRHHAPAAGAAGDPRLAIPDIEYSEPKPMSTALTVDGMTSPAATPTPVFCPCDLPLVLLPVRLETRFFALPDNVTELRVRVYPDKIHLDSHEPDLLPAEQDWGAHYWEQDWRAGNDATARATAWQPARRPLRRRARRLDRAHAAADQSAAAAHRAGSDEPPLPVAPQFPTVTVVTDGQDSAWRHAPQARLMPDRWIAVLRTGRDDDLGHRPRHRPAAGGRSRSRCRRRRRAGRSAGRRSRHEVDGRLRRGRSEGHGVAHHRAAGGAQRRSATACWCSAWRPRSPAERRATQLANLLDAHHYTDGLEFLRFGTPTNNTDDRRAAASKDDPGHARSFANEVASDPAALGAQSNAVRVGTALGLSAAAIAPVLGRIGAARGSTRARHAQHERRAVAGGWGYFLTNMVGFDGTGLTAEPDRLGARSLRHPRAQRRAVSGPALRPAAVRPAAGDLARPVEAAGGPGAGLAPDAWLRDCSPTCATRSGGRASPTRSGSDGGSPTPMPISPTSCAPTVCPAATAPAACSAATICSTCVPSWARICRRTASSPHRMRWRSASCSGWASPGGRAWRAPSPPRWLADHAPLVQAGEVSPWRNLEPNYIGALLAEPRIDGLISARPDPTATADTTSLLQMLLRHALLREMADAAAQIGASAPGADLAALLRDVELVDLVTGAPPTLTWQRQLDSIVAAVTGTRPSGSISKALTASPRRRPRARRFPPQPEPPPGARQRNAAISDAGHARSFDASARCLDHVVRHQAAREHGGARPEGRLRRRLWLGRESAAPACSSVTR